MEGILANKLPLARDLEFYITKFKEAEILT